MAVVQGANRPSPEHTQRQLRTPTEAGGVLRIDPADANQEIAVADLTVEEDWSPVRGAPNLDQVLRVIVGQQPAKAGRLRADLLQARVLR